MHIFTDITFLTILLGTGLLGALSGILGSFAVLNRQSLLGDAISHAALPGIVIAFLVTGNKNAGVLALGAFIAGLIGTYLVEFIQNNSKLKSDAALGIVLSVFFGFGMMLLTYVQKMPNAHQAGLDRYLFGQASTLMIEDIWGMFLFLSLALLVIFLFWKEFKLLSFDALYARSVGLPAARVNILMIILWVLVIVIGLQTVGVVLISSLLLAPAAAARQWANSLKGMVILAGLLGAFSGVMGTWLSSVESHLPTGPVIVIVASLIVFISLIFAPQRGILAKFFHQKKWNKS